MRSTAIVCWKRDRGDRETSRRRLLWWPFVTLFLQWSLAIDLGIDDANLAVLAKEYVICVYTVSISTSASTREVRATQCRYFGNHCHELPIMLIAQGIAVRELRYASRLINDIGCCSGRHMHADISV